MRKRLIYSLSLLFLLFSIGAGITMVYTYRITRDLESVITLHRIEIIRQHFVINTQTVQSNLYATGTIFGKELDIIVENVTALDNSINGCLGCHHNQEMTARLRDVHVMVQQYKEAISYLITTTANEDRIERLKMVAVGIGDALLAKTQEMAFIADRSLSGKTIKAIQGIRNSRVILIVTLLISFVIAFVIAMTLTRQITRPVDALVTGARMIASGKRGYIAPYHDRTEFGEVVESFNAMSSALKVENEKTERYIEQLSGLYNITLSSYMITEMGDIYRRICTDIADLIRVNQCVIITADEGGRMFAPSEAAQSLTEEAAAALTFTEERMEDLSRRSGRGPFLARSLAEIETMMPVTSDTREEASVLGAWLMGKEKILGCLIVADKEGDFIDEDARLLVILANHISVARENAHLYRSLQDKISELHEAQEQLIQSAKLAAIGELASNVAHEINNPLTSIIGFTELTKDEDDPAMVRKNLEIIEQESMRAKDIVQQLLSFARKRPLQIEAMSVNRIIREAVILVKSQAKVHRVALVEEYSELPETMGDPNQLKQVFINIINNAISAMPEGGRLSISSVMVHDWVMITFRDTGPGIPKELQNKIFEPFFTTKKEKGTGLGLSVSYRIIQAHGGRIDVESTEGKGAAFIVRLPFRSPAA